MSKNYIQAPLPFMGQKRKFLKQFKEQLKQCPHKATYVDLFGGSGLLSRTVKDAYPEAKVIYNDFDNYQERINNIPVTNLLLVALRKIIADHPRGLKIPAELKARLLKRIKKEKYVDYITLSSSLLFSMNYVKSFEGLEKETFYNCIKMSDYDGAGYLDGLIVVRNNYKELFEQYNGKPDVVLLVDPPYLSTETGAYNGYWKLADYLDVLTVLNSQSYFYFSSNKSNILELCNWMSSNSNYASPFKDAVISTTSNSISYNSTYTDIMVFKRHSITL